MLNKFVKNVLFVLNVAFTFGIEYINYHTFKKYRHNHSDTIFRLTKRLASINILYVKLFQMFALNNNLIDDETDYRLTAFTNHAPWSYSDVNMQEVREVAEKYNLNIESNVIGGIFPINSGMISAVFKASNKSNVNEKFVIKIKRTNIEETLNDAIDNFSFLMYLLSFIPMVHKYQLTDLFFKNIETIKRQTNFLEEIENMNRIRENCKNLKYVKIPTVLKEATESHPNIIIMEFIEGNTFKDVCCSTYEDYAKLIVKFGLVTTIVHGVTHGDLHNGNILFIEDANDTKYPYKIGVIDFGIVYEINPQYKELMFDLLTGLFERPSRESAVKLLHSRIIHPPGILRQIPQTDYESIVDFTEEIINETIHTSKMANQMQIYKFLSRFKEYLSKREMMNLGIRLSDDFVKSQLVLSMAHGITLRLCKGDFITLLDTCVNELFHTQMLVS